ncbi:hypothetical protein Poli38472_003929 [Pythium oligandrum]|uniref:Disease resistance R13L4/SHOC-2-like LRR domain-containing protein n=1 Tax=Pythium oligandrum TaxID=41045 RepID=A0A8K1FMD4_PYTOL|nr:hypothetical protein Poli38472_003929 [Pythium oligandrum]|eukprot:TMW66164.1 hypothetical protein Poli38472_003929 [Pythium oligandrum]
MDPSVSSSSTLATAGACVFPSLAVDPVTGLDPILYQGGSPTQRTRGFQRKPPHIDRRLEYDITQSHRETDVVLKELLDRHQQRQVALEEQYERDTHSEKHLTRFLETRLATCGVPTLNTMDVRIRREREAALKGSSTKGKATSIQQRVQDAIRLAYGNHVLDLKALDLVHIPQEVYSTLLLQLGGFIRGVNLSRNALRAVPDRFVACFCHAESLNYKENALDALPEAINNLHQLKELNAECNQLRYVPLKLPSSLEHLILTRNRLTTVSNVHALTHLLELEVAYNNLELLPPGMAYLSQLRKLAVTGNRLVTLALLPKFVVTADRNKKPGNVDDQALQSDEQIAAEQKKWRVEVDPATNETIYFHTETKQATRIKPQCFRVSIVPQLPIGKAALTTKHKQNNAEWLAQFPDGWEVSLGGRSLSFAPRPGTSSVPSTAAPPSTQQGGSRMQSMQVTFIHHPTERSFETIPEELDKWGTMHCIHSLSLAGNQLLELPVSIGKLIRLKRLDVENNRLLRLPDTLDQLQVLTTLHLGMNGLTTLPPSLFRLANLTDLDLKLNRFQQLSEEFSALQRLSTLDLSSNALEMLPKAFLQLKKLTTLKLQNNPQLVKSGLLRAETLATGDLDQIMWQLKHQVQCELHGSGAPVATSHEIGVGNEVWSTNLHVNKELTIAIQLAQRTHVLDFHWKKLTIEEFPSVFYTALGNLMELRLSGHELEWIPASFQCFTKLRVLQLRKNNIKRLDDAMFDYDDAALEELDVEYNRITTLPLSIGRLTRLRLLRAANNQIKTVPDSVSQLLELTEVYLAHNRVKQAPAPLGSLVALEKLDISYNQLETLATMDFEPLKRLHTVRLNVNQLTELPDSLALAPIQELCVAGNQFTTLPSTILRLQSTLRVLKLQSNKISRLPLSFGELYRLKVVESDGNPFRSPPAEIMNLGILAIRTYLRKRQQRVDELTRLLATIHFPCNAEAFTGPRLTQFIIRPPSLIDKTNEEQWKHMQFLTEKHFVAFERAVDQYVNGAFYLLHARLRGADIVNEMLLQKQFFLAQSHRERVLRDLVKLCALIRAKRWLDKVDFRYDLVRPWGRNGEDASIYVLNPRALYDDAPELPSVMSVIKKRVYHGFEDEAFEHSEAVVADALTHYVGVYGPVGLIHDEAPFKCGCQDLLRYNKQHEPCFRPGWTFTQLIFTQEEAERRVQDEQAIKDALLALRPQILTYLQTGEGEKRFHKEVRKIKDRLRGELKDKKRKLKKLTKRFQQLKKEREKRLKHEEALKKQGKEVAKTLGEVKEREEQEETYKKLEERVKEWTEEYEKGKQQLGQGYHAFMEDVVTILAESIGIEVRNHLVRQQREKAIAFGLRRPWDGPNGRDFEEYKLMVRRKMLGDGTMEKEDTEGGDAAEKEEKHSDNSEISEVSFDGYDDLVSNMMLEAQRANGEDDEDDDEDDDDEAAPAEALAKLEVSDVSDDDDEASGRPAESEDSDL